MHATHPRSSKYDVIIVGARCAGAATAMLLGRHGARVLAIDRGPYGADTVSTHALMRGAVLQLHRWHVLPAVIEAGTPPVKVTTFFYDDEALTVPIKARGGIDALYAPRRAVLDRILVDAAVDSGAEIVHQVRLRELVQSHEGRVKGAVLEDANGVRRRVLADVVIGADGLRSSVARLVGAQPYHHGRHASGIVYGYWSGLDLEGYRWCYRSGVSVGAIPTNDGLAIVFVALPTPEFHRALFGDVAAGYHRLLREAAPDLADDVRSARQDGGFHGFAGHPGFFRQSWGSGWALVGDAGYFKDPLTAHGITDALRDAELLADAIGVGSELALANYQQTRDDLSRDLFEITDAIASFDWDLAGVRVLHERLVKAMAREVKAMAAYAETSAGMGVPG
jgi:menaquinone-9 beta-reductase